ncbi:MAG: hypothetical protein AAFV53_28295 [Myxococcota bacterium]
MLITNHTPRRISFELRDEKNKPKGYLKLGSPDDKELAAQNKSIPHMRVVPGDVFATLQKNPIFQARLQAGDLSAAPAS